jgi:hypothetical protein
MPEQSAIQYHRCRPDNRVGRHISTLDSALLLLLISLLLQGCATSSMLQQATVASYQPSNVYLAEESLSSQIKRVAVLPLTTLANETPMDFGRDVLWPVLLGELGRARQFEMVAVSPDELRLLTGRNTWSDGERLPMFFFDKLKEKLGVDAVLFSRLTQFRAFEPLSIGWRLKLFDAVEPHILWAVDEVFDARVPGVAAAARRYAQQHQYAGSASSEAQGVLVSPLRFGHYTASAVVETMPSHLSASP